MNKIALLFLLSAGLFASTTNAEVTIKSYKATKAAGGHGWSTMRIYINGLAIAFMYANLDLEQNKHSMIYCIPEKYALKNEDLIALLDGNIADTRLALPESFPIEGVLLQGLKASFPCKGST